MGLLRIESRLAVEDPPHSAGNAVDAVRRAKLGVGGLWGTPDTPALLAEEPFGLNATKSSDEETYRSG